MTDDDTPPPRGPEEEPAPGSPPPDRSPPAPATPARRRTSRRSPGNRTWLDAGRFPRTRDGVLLRLLHEHATLTGPQIQALLFTTPAAARTRLYRLREQGWILSFRAQPGAPALASGAWVRPGHPLPPLHWVLAERGHRWAAGRAGEGVLPGRRWRQRMEAVAASAQLDHLDGVHQFFVSLITGARTLNGPGTSFTWTPGPWNLSARDAPPVGEPSPPLVGEQVRLARWWPSDRASSAIAGRVRPDGHGVLEHRAPQGQLRQTGFFVEYDRGTEPLPVLTGKLRAYRQLRADQNIALPVLFVLPGPIREQHLHQILTESTGSPEPSDVEGDPLPPAAGPDSPPSLPVLTTHLQELERLPGGPAAAVWLPVGAARRIRLGDLPATVPGNAFLDPSQVRDDEDPLYPLGRDLP
ncbi:replication-relaxation family protein [Kineosporia sp. J2-2]|uniref:Replication-relaxation family protein n=1 Tax=Kineosporia corallincola TaxID=2835133 RepID=A0ABS5TR94_9ACTN|nr:replication-relaxation family protein [Kineosporia corallincola]MBT0772959.1 replication-relaxation family protein [Kineosporia corallincola]